MDPDEPNVPCVSCRDRLSGLDLVPITVFDQKGHWESLQICSDCFNSANHDQLVKLAFPSTVGWKEQGF